MQHRRLLWRVDLAAELADMDIDDVGVRQEAVVPDVFQQHAARHHLAGAVHEIFQQLELGWQQLDGTIIAPGGAGNEIEHERADAKRGRWRGDRRAAQQRLDAGGEFNEGEGLDEIVIAAGLQARHPFIDRAERAHHQNRGRDALGAQFGQHREPITLGQQAVEDQQIEAPAARLGETLRAGHHMPHLIAARLQIGDDLAGEFGVILDQQDGGRGALRFRVPCRRRGRSRLSHASAPHPAQGIDPPFHRSRITGPHSIKT